MRAVVLLAALLAPLVAAQADLTWCGKPYPQGSVPRNPGGQFPVPAVAASPQLAFRCAAAIRPYIAGEDKTAAAVIDAALTNLAVAGAQPISLKKKAGNTLLVQLALDGRPLASARVPVNSTGTVIPFALTGVRAQPAPHALSCVATLEGTAQSFSAQADVLLLPPPPKGIGNVVKMDARSGATLVKTNGAWTPIFPFGFYTSFDNYLAVNLSILDDAKARGINTVHPISTFGNLTALGLVLDHMEELGLWLMYDMRFTYMNDTAVTEEVNEIKSRSNVLWWYTGDEPDGTSDALTAPTHARDLINSLDGYRPVSLVLNCQDYFFAEYAAGADIVMQDTYPVGINATHSVRFDTDCTPELGDCGCDNCRGVLEDIADRMDDFAQRLDWLGTARTTAVVTVPQGFGGSEYWSRPPTGAEYVVENVLAINHGAKGSFAWNMPTTDDIMRGATAIGHALPSITPILLSPDAAFSHACAARVDVGAWVLPGERRALVLATNADAAPASVRVDVLQGVLKGKKVKSAKALDFGGDVKVLADGTLGLQMSGTGSVGVILSW